MVKNIEFHNSLNDVELGDMKDFLGSDCMINFYTRCFVDYSGRTSTDLKRGDRCVMLKPDGTLSVQAGEGLRPKNWQPSGGEFSFYYEEEVPVIECVREQSGDKEAEIVKVYCEEIHGIVVYSFKDDEEIEMIGSEEDMHDRIMEDPEIIEDGFRASENEKSTSVGAIDVFGYDKEGRPVIVEVKRRKAELKHVDQLKRYTEHFKKNVDENTRGILVAPETSQNAKKLLDKNNLELKKLDPLEISRDKNHSTTKLSDY